MPVWFVTEGVRGLFPDHTSAIVAPGEEINRNWMSRLVRCRDGDDYYYIKTYASRGRGLRRFIGRSRVRAEWENLQEFVAMEIPTAELVAYGESEVSGNYRGTLITREVRGAIDLATMVDNSHSLFCDRQWRLQVIGQLSEIVQKMQSPLTITKQRMPIIHQRRKVNSSPHLFSNYRAAVVPVGPGFPIGN